MLRLTKQSDPSAICTRIYPLGEGEGINQLTIRDVNNGVPYIQSPKSVIDRYGVIERVWIDRKRQTSPNLSKASKNAIIKQAPM
jgi:phage minor structural protein